MSMVLVVEDDVSVGDVVEEVLLENGYTAVRAANGQEALDILTSGKLPDVILLDLMMPIIDGHQLLALLAAHERWREIPVIVTSANSKPVAPVQAILRKPYNLDELLAALHRTPPPPTQRSVG